MLGEITDEIRKAWQCAHGYQLSYESSEAKAMAARMAYALRDQLAAKLKAEHDRIANGPSLPATRHACNGKCPETDSQWQAEAERILTGVD